MKQHGDTHPVREDDSLWYKDAIIYQVHPRAFYDRNNDGVGDFRGLTEKLDYLKDLGITAIWLLPFYPSPMRDDGYDIAEYTGINPLYGTKQDFRRFMREAHRRGLRVITELVINHTSDQHPWFQRARQSPPGSQYRDFYVWSQTPDRYRGTRVIFNDFEPSNWTWDPVADAYYWHRFYSHQPDLNFDSPRVRRAVIRVLDFWMKLGVDGVRLDAIPYLYEREGTSCENLPETHAFLKELRRHMDRDYPGRMLLAEANQWPEDAVAYFGDGDECHMAFHFPLMPRLFMGIRMADRFPIMEIMSQTPRIPDSCQWAIFLRNHDELTLEMVTDEERDYMYRFYARDRQARINLGIRRRLNPLMGNDRRKVELMNGILFSMPGTPIIYYGDEIGMGDNFYLGDRNSVRTPMQWSTDRNAGFSGANPQQLFLPVIIDPEYHFETVNVEGQQMNPNSLLWWMKRLISLRKRFKAFSQGSLEFLQATNNKVLTFVRRFRDETVLVVANLSQYTEYTELDLSEFQGMTLVEMSGRRRFPTIEEDPYRLTLGPYTFYWFSAEPQRVQSIQAEEVPLVQVSGAREPLLRPENYPALEAILPAYLYRCRWFAGQGRAIRAARIADYIPLAGASRQILVTLVNVEYVDGDPDTYLVPMVLAAGEDAHRIQRHAPQAVLARLQAVGTNETQMLYDALWDEETGMALLEAIERRRRYRGNVGELVSIQNDAFPVLRSIVSGKLRATTFLGDQSNTSVIYHDHSRWNIFLLKCFRRLEPGTHPELELLSSLSEGHRFTNVPPVAGAIEYHGRSEDRMTMVVLQGYVVNEGDAWQYTMNTLPMYYEKALARSLPPDLEDHLAHPLDLAGANMANLAEDLVGPYLEFASLLGKRSAELHAALADGPRTPSLQPEPFTDFYRRSLYQSMRNLCRQVVQRLRQQEASLPGQAGKAAQLMLRQEESILTRFRLLANVPITATSIRCHGNLHLGEVLHMGNDVVFVDFEGESTRPLNQRRFKSSPLKDVAGMMRSFHYVAHAALRNDTTCAFRPEDQPLLEQWALLWSTWTSVAYLQGYMGVPGATELLPPEPEHIKILLDAHLLEKALYEVGNELDHRPDWLPIPLQGITQVLEVTR